MTTGPQPIQPARQEESPHGPAAAVPLAEAKNRLSALVDLVEQGEDVTISRRGVQVARLVPLAAVWVFDFPRQHDWTITAANNRACQLQAIAEANARIRAAVPGSENPDKSATPTRR